MLRRSAGSIAALPATSHFLLLQVDFALTDQAIVLGWTLDNSVPERPILIPPKTPPPAADTTEAAAEAPSAPAAPEVDAEAAEKD